MYEDNSLRYTGIDRHIGQNIGGWDTIIDVPNNLPDLPAEIKVYPLIIKPNNEIYRMYEVKPCTQIDYGLYVANFIATYDGMRISMNLYAMDGVMLFIKDDKAQNIETENNAEE